MIPGQGPNRTRRGARRGPTTFLALVLSVALGTLVGGVTLVAAQTAQDPSEVVLVFDVSDSILESDDGTNVEFATALDDIADRVEAIANDLAVGNATVSFVAFGRTARPYPGGCQQLAAPRRPRRGVAVRGLPPPDRDGIPRRESCAGQAAHQHRGDGPRRRARGGRGPAPGWVQPVGGGLLHRWPARSARVSRGMTRTSSPRSRPRSRAARRSRSCPSGSARGPARSSPS